MGAAKRKPSPALIQQLLDDPSSFEFFRAVEVLEQHLGTVRKRRGILVGGDRSPSDLGLRFHAQPTLGFPAAQVATARRGEEELGLDEDYAMVVSFLGMVGPAGTLPIHYTETLLERLHAKDQALRTFLDSFQGRTVALFYRAWKKYRMAVSFGQSDLARGEADPILNVFLALTGRRPRKRGRPIDAIELAEVHHATFFADCRRSAHGLRAMLSGVLRCDVRVDQFVGQWIDLDPDARGRLGGGRGPGVQARLGEETVLGARVWSVDSRVRIVAGPLGRERFRELWPGGPQVRYVRGLVEAFLGPLLDYDLEWELAPEAPVPLQLGGDERLGRDCWLGWSDEGRPDLRVASPPWNEQADEARSGAAASA